MNGSTTPHLVVMRDSSKVIYNQLALTSITFLPHVDCKRIQDGESDHD